MKRPVTPYIVLAVGITIASTAAILFKYAAQAGAPALVIAAGRLVTAALILSPLAWSRAGSQIRAISRRDGWLAMLAGVLLAIHFAAWFASLVYTSVASSTALVATNPIFVGIASVVLFKERLARPVIIGIAVAITGSLIIGLSDSGGAATGSNPLLGDGLALVGAMAGSGYFLAGRAVRKRVDLLPYIWCAYSTAAVTLLIWALLSGHSFAGYSWVVYAAILGLALGPQLLGHTSFNWSLRYMSATFVAVAALGEPIGSTVLALLLLGQVPQPLQVLGGLLLLSGIYISTLGERRAVVATADAEIGP